MQFSVLRGRQGGIMEMRGRACAGIGNPFERLGIIPFWVRRRERKRERESVGY